MRRYLATTRGRLVAFAIAILAVALVIADGAVLGSLSLAQSHESDAGLVAQARVISSTVEDSNGHLTLDGPDIPGETQSGIAVDAAVVSAGGVLAQSSAQPIGADTLNGLAQRARDAHAPVWADLKSPRGGPRRAYAVPLGESSIPSAVLIVSRSVGELQRSWQRTMSLLLVASTTLLLVGGALAHWLAGSVLRPVRTIAGIARTISERDLHRRVDLDVPRDELGELVDTFNAMLARLEASFASLQRFTADASHELRAPLTLMRSELDGALGKGRSQEEYMRVLGAVQDEVDHMTRIADGLLLLARADAGVLTPAREKVDVADCLHEAAARWETIAEARGTTISVSAPPAGSVRADPVLIRRVLDNLIDNATNHAPSGTPIQLAGYASADSWNFEVVDQGPGVPSGHVAQLFSRFAKLDSAHPRGTAGAGLGLALSAAIARAHGGRLTLVEDRHPGAAFLLQLPKDRDS